jgi:hypothetical protein
MGAGDILDNAAVSGLHICRAFLQARKLRTRHATWAGSQTTCGQSEKKPRVAWLRRIGEDKQEYAAWTSTCCRRMLVRIPRHFRTGQPCDLDPAANASKQSAGGKDIDR